MKKSEFQIKWTIAIFNTKFGDPKKWRNFRLKYKRNFTCSNNINNHNKISIWFLNKERIEWIKKELPKECDVRFIEITDYQFRHSTIHYGSKK